MPAFSRGRAMPWNNVLAMIDEVPAARELLPSIGSAAWKSSVMVLNTHADA